MNFVNLLNEFFYIGSLTLRKLFVFVLSTIFIVGCSSSKSILKSYKSPSQPYFEIPRDWIDSTARAETINYYANFLKGRKFFIDPGHGGKDRKNRSLDGKIVEADVNLRVALNLRNYLEKAGSIVYMSRTKDTTVSLKERSKLADESGAKFFISIHHNAPGMKDNYWTDYTAVFYHATQNSYAYKPSEHDMAKYVERDLAYVVRNSGGLGSFDGTYSDYKIYPGEGFSVLRLTKIPAILIECAFQTNRMEELRLTNHTFNKIEAWGIFRGLGKYFRAGIPKIRLLKEKSSLINDTLKLSLKLDDKSGIKPESIVTYSDSMKTKHYFNDKTEVLSLILGKVKSGQHSLRVICENKNGNHSLPYHLKIITKNISNNK